MDTMCALAFAASEAAHRDSKSQQLVYARNLAHPIFPKDFCHRTQAFLNLLSVSQIYPECTQLGGQYSWPVVYELAVLLNKTRAHPSNKTPRIKVKWRKTQKRMQNNNPLIKCVHNMNLKYHLFVCQRMLLSTLDSLQCLFSICLLCYFNLLVIYNIPTCTGTGCMMLSVLLETHTRTRMCARAHIMYFQSNNHCEKFDDRMY